MKYSRKILFLILFQLLVFFAPFLVKAFHHHTFSLQVKREVGITDNSANRSCPICQYEFSINDIPRPLKISFNYFHFISTVISTIEKGYLSDIFSFTSPRAPPSGVILS